MRFSEMTKDQRREEALFTKRLSEAGWNTQNTAKLIRAGISVSPEGYAQIKTKHAQLDLELFLPQRRVHLFILSLDSCKTARLRFEYENNLEYIVEWVISRQNVLTTENFAESLSEMIDSCKRVYFVDNSGTGYLLRRDTKEE